MTQEIASKAGFFVGQFLGVFMVGAICGLLPLIAGLCRRNRRVAAGSWALCVLVGLVGWMVTSTPEVSLCISLPLAFVFMVVILCSPPKPMLVPSKESVTGVDVPRLILSDTKPDTCDVKQGKSAGNQPTVAEFAVALTPITIVVLGAAACFLSHRASLQEVSASTPTVAPVSADKTKGTWIETDCYKYQVIDGGYKWQHVALYKKERKKADQFLGWLGGIDDHYLVALCDPNMPYLIGSAIEAAEVIERHRTAALLSPKNASGSIWDFDEQFRSSTTAEKNFGTQERGQTSLYVLHKGKKMTWVDIHHPRYMLNPLYEGEFISGDKIVGIAPSELAYVVCPFVTQWKVIHIDHSEITVEKDGKKWVYRVRSKGWSPIESPPACSEPSTSP